MLVFTLTLQWMLNQMDPGVILPHPFKGHHQSQCLVQGALMTPAAEDHQCQKCSVGPGSAQHMWHAVHVASLLMFVDTVSARPVLLTVHSS